jgi:heme exporter protein C
MWSYFAQPARFIKLSSFLAPFLFTSGVILLISGIIWGNFFAPVDYLQGKYVALLYIHVPLAWLSLMVYSVMVMFALAYVIWKHVIALYMIERGIILGLCASCICLITGMLWGIPTWGTHWVWDARLTSTFILLVIYIVIWFVFKYKIRTIFRCYILLIGAINIPIIKYSVEWWHTLHQPSSISTLTTLVNPTIDSAMLTPLLISAVGHIMFFVSLWLYRALTALALQRQQRA